MSPMIGIEGEDLVLAQDGLERRRHRLELECDVGTDPMMAISATVIPPLALAVAGDDEVGDRGDVLRLGEPDHAAKRRAQADQDRADIDGEKSTLLRVAKPTRPKVQEVQ
jgi:hypothetical protein